MEEERARNMRASEEVNHKGRAAALVAAMTRDEKAALCSGQGFWRLQGNERLGLPSVMVTDGPHGLRKQAASQDHVGLNASVPATCFPTASALASTWNTDLLRQVGEALGRECAAQEVAVLLGPGLNIKRHPLCGRNFEYFSEDPLLSGELAAAMIAGIQSQGVGACPKHFAVNNQERRRMTVDVVVDERTLREIYLRGFEIAIKKGKPWTLMCAYNRLAGAYCSEHELLLTRILRQEWGFDGLVMSDWGAVNDRVKGLRAGLDLEMPGSGGVNDRRIAAAVEAGALLEETLDQAAIRVVSLVQSSTAKLGGAAPDKAAHHALAQQAATEGAVLLKNDDGLLPLRAGKTIAIVGAFAKLPRYQGAGSSRVNPSQVDCAFDAIARLVGRATALHYAPGYDAEQSQPNQALLDEAAATAKDVEAVLVFAGLPEAYESEGFDRLHMRLPEQHDRLIEAVCAVNPNVAVVLANGAPVEMPWADASKAILEGYLGGQAGGAAMADLLFGLANPSGKLAESFPLRQEDAPADPWFPGAGRQVQYREGLGVGYRHYETAQAAVLFPFGHGLSYTQFHYRDLEVRTDQERPEVRHLSLILANVGPRAGAEVVQVYVRPLASGLRRPALELRAFAKVALASNQVRQVDFTLDNSAFSHYSTRAGAWQVQPGDYEIRIGASCKDIRLKAAISVAGGSEGPAPSPDVEAQPDAPASAELLNTSDAAFASALGHPIPRPDSPRPFHLNSTLREISETWLGRKVKVRIMRAFTRRMKLDKADAATRKMFTEMLEDMPLRALALHSAGALGFLHIEALAALLNNRILTALRLLLRRR